MLKFCNLMQPVLSATYFLILAALLQEAQSSPLVQTGMRIQLQSTVNKLFVTVDADGTLTTKSTVGWIHGSTFEVAVNQNQWQLRALKTGKWVSAVNSGGGALIANYADSPSGWETYNVQFPADGQVQLEAIIGGQWVGMSSTDAGASLVAKASQPSGWESFFVTIVPMWKGVNLGSLFVPENWMVPSFYAGSGKTDLCSFVFHNRGMAEQRMRQHLQTFVNKGDFDWIASQGFNAVRVPLGYWNVIAPDSAGIPYVPSDTADSLAVIDNIFDWANEHGISILLDMHGGPGSQNGADHSGCSSDGVAWNTTQNKQLSLDVISALANRYGSRKNLIGFELLNEPGWNVEFDRHGDLLDYYTKAYGVVRAASKTAMVVFNELYRWPMGDWWNGQLVEPDFYNVVMDLHQYDCYGDASKKSTQDHIKEAESWANEIDALQASTAEYKNHPVLVGEWSMATGQNPGGQAYADAQVNSFGHGIGWFFWSLKKEGRDPNWALYDAIGSGIHFGGKELNHKSTKPSGFLSSSAANASLLI